MDSSLFLGWVMKSTEKDNLQKRLGHREIFVGVISSVEIFSWARGRGTCYRGTVIITTFFTWDQRPLHSTAGNLKTILKNLYAFAQDLYRPTETRNLRMVVHEMPLPPFSSSFSSAVSSAISPNSSISSIFVYAVFFEIDTRRGFLVKWLALMLLYFGSLENMS